MTGNAAAAAHGVCCHPTAEFGATSDAAHQDELLTGLRETRLSEGTATSVLLSPSPSLAVVPSVSTVEFL